MIRQLDDRTLVSGQIAPHEVAGLAEHGITVIVNNRPDGEEPGQPLAADIEAAAAAGGNRLPLRADHPRDRPGRRRRNARSTARSRRRQDACVLQVGNAIGAGLRACAAGAGRVARRCSSSGLAPMPGSTPRADRAPALERRSARRPLPSLVRGRRERAHRGSALRCGKRPKRAMMSRCFLA